MCQSKNKTINGQILLQLTDDVLKNQYFVKKNPDRITLLVEIKNLKKTKSN